MLITTIALLAFILLLASIALRGVYEFGLSLGDNADEHMALFAPRPFALSPSQQRHPIYAIVLLVLGARLATWLLAWLLFIFRENQLVGFFDSLKTIWWRWDAVHYLNIAAHGYVTDAMPEKLNLVFYPLYPALVALIGLSGIPLFAASLIASLAAFCAATIVLYRLVERESQNPQLAWDCCKILVIFPFSFFFAMPYTESLFLLLTLLSFWYLRGGYWLLAGLFAALAGFTRNQGILLLIPFAVEILLRWRNGELNRPWRALLGLALVPLGLLAYLAINHVVTGNWLQFLIYQRQNWSQSFGFMPSNVANAFSNLLQGDLNLALGTWLPTVLCYFAAIALLLTSGRQLPLPYLAYAAVYLWVSYSPSWLLSGPRYLMSLFPLVIATGILMQKNRYWHQAIELIMLFGLGFFLLMYIHYQVY
ncbi:mannosyltransferase family protein [uncultured Deefgea sp.]|uniref:mannosyltransferase family protein n=1 Tax=uncultured Deefgea sp. TaxID=1304914 RepID=UPI0025983E1F|nr:mannosyltransferase family protein [uncultured Deefgea sp.]